MNQTLLVQISDLHIREPGRLAYGRINTAPYLEKAVVAINQLPQKPDAVIITGDLTDFGRIAEYDHLRTLLAPLSVPVYMLPGNHDERNILAQSFPQQDYLKNIKQRLYPVCSTSRSLTYNCFRYQRYWPKQWCLVCSTTSLVGASLN